jgi:hypothetical protein
VTRVDRALQRAIAEACLGARAGEEIANDLRRFLERHGVEPEDIEAILAAPPRLAVYRSLVRNGIAAVVLRMMPRTRERMNGTGLRRFEAYLAAFVDQIGPRTHYLRDVPAEFFAWAQARWRGDPTLPAYIADLASYELAAFQVAAAEGTRAGEAVAKIELDRSLAFVGSTRLMNYGWAVHELPLDATSEPARREVWLLAYRDDDGVSPEAPETARMPRWRTVVATRSGQQRPAHGVRWLELTPLAAAIVGRLLLAEPLGAAVARACADHGVTPSAVLAEIAKLLADLGARHVLLGARASVGGV